MEYEGWNKYKNGNETYCSKTTLFMYGEDAEIMQFTNLTDKNGVDAYIKDKVVDVHGQEFVIEWDYPLLARLSEIEFEIIGNVYENE